MVSNTCNYLFVLFAKHFQLIDHFVAGLHFFILNLAEEVKSLQKEHLNREVSAAIEDLADQISASSIFSLPPDDGEKMCLQWRLALKVNLSNEVRHRSLTVEFSVLVERFLNIQLIEKELKTLKEFSFEKREKLQKLLKQNEIKWTKSLEKARQLIFFTNLDWGPKPIYLKSWLDCGGKPKVAAELENYLVNRLLWDQQANNSLPNQLKTVNDLFIMAYFCDSVNRKDTRIMKNVTIQMPFCLPYVGKMVRQDQVETEFFEVRRGIYISAREDDNIVKLSSMRSGLSLFELSSIRLGCFSLKREVTSSIKKLQSLQMEPTGVELVTRSSVMTRTEPRFLSADFDIAHELLYKLDSEGFAVVTFNGSFHEIQIDTHFSSLFDDVKRQSFKPDGTDKVKEWLTTPNGSVEMIISSMRDACTELMNKMDAALSVNDVSVIHKYGHQELMIMAPGAKNQRPKVDAVQRTICSDKRVSEGNISVICKPIIHCFDFSIIDYISGLLVSVNCSSIEQSIHIWPETYRAQRIIDAAQYPTRETLRDIWKWALPSCEKKTVSIPVNGCVVFLSGCVYSGAANSTNHFLLQGYCSFVREPVTERVSNAGLTEVCFYLNSIMHCLFNIFYHDSSAIL